MSEHFDLAVVKRMLPKSHHSLVTQEFLDKMEASIKDSEIAETFKENFVTYIGVLTQGKYKMTDYINAVKYISYKLMGFPNIRAYACTFPERYKTLVERNDPNLDNYVCMYNKNKLVNLIYEQTMVPTYVLNAPLHQEALNELAKMIKDPSVKGMTKVKACEAILTHTKAPEVVKGEIMIGVEQSDTIAQLREVTEQLAANLRNGLERQATTLKKVAESKIIDVTPMEAEE